MKNLILSIVIISISAYSCKKNSKNSCEFNECDSRRKTVYTANLWTGYLGYYNDLRKWAVNYPIPGTTDGLRTCIICIDIPDSLKTIGRQVVFSGELKESCGSPTANLGHQEIYFINPIILK